MKNRNIFWGLIFIIAAAFVLLSNFNYFEGINITKILLTILLIYYIIKNIPSRNFYGILIPIAFICILYDELLHLTAITPFPLLAAAIFGSIGLSFIFPRQPHFQSDAAFAYNGKDTVDHLNESDVNCCVSFAGTTKYIDTLDFRRAYLKCSFGSLKLYFDHAQISGDSAEIYVENVFGETVLYLPKEWNVAVSVTTSFGDIEEIHKTALPSDALPRVTVCGNISFGDCKIYYI